MTMATARLLRARNSELRNSELGTRKPRDRPPVFRSLGEREVERLLRGVDRTFVRPAALLRSSREQQGQGAAGTDETVPNR